MGGSGRGLAWPFLPQLPWMGMWAHGQSLARFSPNSNRDLAGGQDQYSANSSLSRTPSGTGLGLSQAEQGVPLGHLAGGWVVLVPSSI